MILGNKLIKDFIQDNYDPNSLNPASYDLRASDDIEIEPGKTELISTIEYVALPIDLSGFIKDKSSFLRLKVNVGQGYVDPGFRGNLTVSVTNHSDETVRIRKGMRFCQIVFMMTVETKSGYDGHYQDQDGLRESVLKDEVTGS